MKKLSKKIISLVLALVMAMPVVFALPQTEIVASASDENKVIEWVFTGSSKKGISSPTADVNDSYNQTVAPTYGSGTLNLHNWSTGDRHFHYDDDNTGMKSTDGVASLRNLSSLLADGKDIEIKFTMAINANASTAEKGVFAIGSTFGDFADTANTANDLVYLSNTGDIRYKSTSSNTDIKVSGTTTSVTEGVFFKYRIYFSYNARRIDIYRNNVLIATKQDDSIDKSKFGCLVLGAHIPNKFGNFAIKSLTVSQFAPEDEDGISSLCSSSLIAEPKSFNGSAYHYSSVASGGYTDGTVVYHATGNLDYSGKKDKAYMDHYYYIPKNLVLAYDGTKSNLYYPVVFVQKKNGDHTQQMYNVALVAGTNQTLEQKWKGYTDVSGSYSLTNSPWPGLSGSNEIDYVNDSSSSSSPDNKNTPRAYANKVKYTGDVTSNANYYETLNSVTFRYKGSYKDGCNTKTETLDYTATNYSVYIINYKPIYDILKSSNPTTVTVNGQSMNIRQLRNYLVSGDGAWMYTKASREIALRRIAAVGEADPMAYSYSTASSDVSSAATEIKNAYTDFTNIASVLVKNTFTITYDMLGTDKSATLEAGKTISQASGDAIPSLTSGTPYASDNKHHTYSWSSSGVWDNSTTPSGTHVPHSNETYKENDILVNCSFADDVHSATDAHNGYTDKKCSVCNHVDESKRVYNELNWTAYETALSNYNTEITTNRVDYTTTSVGNCESYASGYTGYNRTANTGANTPQSAISTATSALTTAVGKLKTKADFSALDTAYTNAQSAFAALTASDYTTSTYALVNTYLTTAGNFPYHSKDAAARADTAAETYQTAINSERDALANALSGLELRADFTALDTAKNDALNELDSLASANTTSSVATARTYLTSSDQFPYAYSNAANRADTGVSKNGEIATEATKFGNWKIASPLEAKASFTALDTAKNDAIAELDGLASGYTTSSVAAARTYLTSSAQFPYEYSADRADTGVSKNSEIATEATKFGNWQTAVTLDPLADLTEFDKAYAKADALLKDLAGKTAQYDEASVQALIEAVTTDKASAGTNITAGTIAAATTARADYGKAVEDDAKELTENIYDAINGLTLAAVDEVTHEPVDTSVYDSLVNTINNLDPDAYEDVYDEETEKYVLESARSTINSTYGAETLEYDGQNINVINGITSQLDAEAAATRLQTALTVCTKKYTISRTGVTDFGVINGKEEGGKVNYGATLTCKSSDNDTAWFLEVETGSMHKKLAFQGYGKTLKTKVLGATTVKAVKRDSTNNCKVIVYRNYGDERRPIQYATFVPSGTDFTLPASPAIAYTTFNGYSYKGGDAIAANGEGEYIITVTEDVEIVANYTEAAADCAINATDINNVAHNSTVSYNDKVELDGGAGTYGWVEQIGTTYRPFYKGQKVTFLATESTTLVAVNEETFESYGTAPIINMRKGGVIVSESKYMFNAQIVPGDADIRECGILLAAPSSKNGATPITPADSQVIIENSGQQVGYAILRAKSTKLVGANQFTVAINNVPAGYKYRGYIIYHDGNSLQTVYSDVLTK